MQGFPRRQARASALAAAGIRKHRRVALRLVELLAMFAYLATQVTAQPRLTKDQWRQDLKFLATELPVKHKNLFFKLPKAEFERRVARIDESIPTLTDLQIRAELVRLVASVGNEHTSINAFAGAPSFPILFATFRDGILVTAAPADQPQAVGARLVAINGTPIAEIRDRLAPYIAQENDISLLVGIPALLRMAAPLSAERILPAMDRAAFELERDGAPFTLDLRSAQKPNVSSLTRGSEPRLYSEHRTRGLDYWFEYLPEQKTIYVQYNDCRNMKEQSFEQFTGEVMKTADSRATARFIIDLRFNGGGNSAVIRPLLTALQARKMAQVFALVGHDTFSSGFMAALDLRKYSQAVLVGEAMGQRPNSYSDIRRIQLPNSGIVAWYCTQYFRLAATGDPPHIEPDVLVPIEAKDYFSGRDAAFEYALSH
jgi:hypothetical protein